MKRIVDIIIAATAILLLSPIILISSFFIFYTMGPPILFKQKRAGQLGQSYCLYKLRTMTSAKDNEGKTLPDEDRITHTGRILRKTSLDELPQLFNVLRGSMSIVGPRPLPLSYIKKYTSQQARRLLFKPGITGWCQINYSGNERTWREKLTQDCWYIDNWSILLDFQILIHTIPAVLKRFNMNNEGTTTSIIFDGNSLDSNG